MFVRAVDVQCVRACVCVCVCFGMCMDAWALRSCTSRDRWKELNMIEASKGMREASEER